MALFNRAVARIRLLAMGILISMLILAAAAVRPEKFFTIMTSRYMKTPGLALNDKGISAMRRMLLLLAAVFTLHTILTVYAAFRMSQAAWAFISGGLFYIIFGVITAGQFMLMVHRRHRTP